MGVTSVSVFFHQFPYVPCLLVYLLFLPFFIPISLFFLLFLSIRCFYRVFRYVYPQSLSPRTSFFLWTYFLLQKVPFSGLELPLPGGDLAGLKTSIVIICAPPQCLHKLYSLHLSWQSSFHLALFLLSGAGGTFILICMLVNFLLLHAARNP